MVVCSCTIILNFDQFCPVVFSVNSRFVIRISGALPTPCHNIRVIVSEADDNNNIQVEVYSLSDPNEICIQVLEPFEIIVPLGVYTSGEYQVVVNEKGIGEIKP